MTAEQSTWAFPLSLWVKSMTTWRVHDSSTIECV
jgi:hypothetical protein